MSSYVEKLDSGFLAHFSRRLAEVIIEQGSEIVQAHGITTPITAISTIFFLTDTGSVTVAELAEALGVTHQMTTQRVNSLEKLGLIYRKPNPQDKRAKTIHLTKLGMTEEKLLRPIMRDINLIFDQLNKEVGCELMSKIRQAELALVEKSLVKRLNELD
ncbi:MarR family transcriptional regulator [Glaciecola sp. MH2013]|uniref:MarR family winged helix-turn-helix transcriptional regulator n=1 Tax=Glaciecola sp. MH2013 TaxID=2785524 RepID=UPI00189C9393|nr:MarR family transcriptional regulator [Glaciecola sp. MH2013]MBF7072099.1 MarR family transcriptional regulator [Glaciecola sp. MH2013]